jgi:hypothetical protein
MTVTGKVGDMSPTILRFAEDAAEKVLLEVKAANEGLPFVAGTVLFAGAAPAFTRPFMATACET